jgi:putative effector of murein hydrolase
MHVRDQATRGFASGVTSHGIGAVRAFQESEQAGAFSGLAMGLDAPVTAPRLPLRAHLISFG